MTAEMLQGEDTAYIVDGNLFPFGNKFALLFVTEAEVKWQQIGDSKWREKGKHVTWMR